MITKEKNQRAIKKAVELALKFNANTTTCGLVFQPKAPAELKKFKK